MRAGRTIVEVELGRVKFSFIGFPLLLLTNLMFFSDLWEMGILSPGVREMQEM